MTCITFAGDTDAVTFGEGSFGSRSAALAGSAVHLAAAKVIDKAKKDRGASA